MSEQTTTRSIDPQARLDLRTRWLDPRIVVPVLTLLLVALTAHRVFAAPLWGDEMRTWRDGIERPLGDVLRWQHNPDHAPLGHLMARAGAAIFGVRHAWALRLGAWLCGLACVPALWRLGRRVHSDAAGYLMAAMFLVDPTEVFQLTQARMYSAMLLAGIVALTLAVGLLDVRVPRMSTLIRAGSRIDIDGTDERTHPWHPFLRAVLLGLAVGVGIWSHGQIYAVVLAIAIVALLSPLLPWHGPPARGESSSRRDRLMAAEEHVPEARATKWHASLLLLLGVAIGLGLGAQGVSKLLHNRSRTTIVDTNRAAMEPPAGQLEDATQALTGHNVITGLVVASTLVGLGFLVRRGGSRTALLPGLVAALAVVNLLVAARYRPIGYARYLAIAQPALWAGIAVALVEVARLTAGRSRAWLALPIVAFAGWLGLCVFQLTRTIELLPAHPLAGPFRDAVAFVQAHRASDARAVVLPGSPLATYARYYGLTSDAEIDEALTKPSGRGRRRTTTAPAVVDVPELWLIGVAPTTPRWRLTGDDPTVANTTIARARGVRTPAALPAGDDRGKSEVVVVRYDADGATEATHFVPRRGSSSAAEEPGAD